MFSTKTPAEKAERKADREAAKYARKHHVVPQSAYLGLIQGSGFGSGGTFHLRGADQVVFKPLGREAPFTESARSLRVEVSDIGQDASRVTVARLLAVGVFAFALKKQTSKREVLVTFTRRDTGEPIFAYTLPSDAERGAIRAAATWNRVTSA